MLTSSWGYIELFLFILDSVRSMLDLFWPHEVHVVHVGTQLNLILVCLLFFHVLMFFVLYRQKPVSFCIFLRFFHSKAIRADLEPVFPQCYAIWTYIEPILAVCYWAHGRSWGVWSIPCLCWAYFGPMLELCRVYVGCLAHLWPFQKRWKTQDSRAKIPPKAKA